MPTLVVRLVVQGLLRILLLVVQDVASPSQELAAGDEGRADNGLSVRHDALAAELLDFARVHLQHMVLGLKTRVVREENDSLGTGVQLVGGLLDEGGRLIDLVQCLVAEGVGLGQIGADELVGPRKVRQDGLSKGLVGRVADFEGPLAVWVLPEGRDAVVNQGVVEEVLAPLSVIVFSSAVSDESNLEEGRVPSRARNVAVDLGHRISTARRTTCRTGVSKPVRGRTIGEELSASRVSSKCWWLVVTVL